MMKTLKTFVSGLVLSAICLLPSALQAAELQPFFTLKVSSVNSLTAIADKFAGMAGTAEHPQFREVIAIAKGIKGLNPNGIIGFAAADNDGEIVPMLMLPVTDIWNLEVPNFPNIGDQIRPFLVKKGERQYVISSPLGNYIATQKKDYLIVAPENYADQVPADAPKLFAALDKYAFGVKLDLEKVDFDTIEGQVFGPILLMVSMQNPDAGEQMEGVIEMYRQLFKEFSALTLGVAVNPQTADIEYSGTAAARKGSEWAKILAGVKPQPTIFSGFRGTLENNVISFGYSMSQGASNFNNAEMLNVVFAQYEAMLTGFMEQIEEDGTPEDAAAKAKKVIDSVKKIVNTETKKGSSDSAFSFDTAGTLLAAADTASLEEIRNLVAMIKDYVGKKVPADAKSFLEKNGKKEYTTVEGFKVSSLTLPLSALADTDIGDQIAPFTDMTLGIFWAVKETPDKQAVAMAAGLDFAKTEQAFKAALEKTKTAVPVQPPMGTISTPGIGKFLQQTVTPIVEKADVPEENVAILKKVAGVLAAADADAKITLDFTFKPDQMEEIYRISGKSVQAVINAIKAGIEANNNPDRPAVQDF
jgi:hypothetical protein